MKQAFVRFAAGYGMVFVLLLLCAYYSFATLAEQHPTGPEAAAQVSGMLQPNDSVAVIGGDSPDDVLFVDAMKSRCANVRASLNGQPADARAAFERLQEKATKLDAIAVTPSVANWSVFDNLAAKFPALGTPRMLTPRSYRWPNFLKTDNLLNVANQIAVIAIIAIGMTFVIVTAGIDLSVGSLIALSAVVAALLIRRQGAEHAGAFAMILGCLAAMALCMAVGTFSGLLITLCEIPPFITTLAMMLVASGLAYLLSEGQSIYQLPDSFIWLGRSTVFAGIPTAVVLMLVLYALAHVVMTRTLLGRYVYAVGGNREAARLSGVPVKSVFVLVYAVSGCLAGLGGVIMASQLKSGSPTYGNMYELYVIASVVVGGTSLSGGEGKVLGTLIGALIIAVIQNGMNLTGVESYTQKVVLGLVILGAVLLDRVKRNGQRLGWSVFKFKIGTGA
jgi:ribose transport system permease protein